jgi:transposase-like protein
VQYGQGVKTWATYFNNQHFISVERTAQIFKDLLGHAPSEATLLKVNQELVELIEPSRLAVKAQLQQADVLHVDETGLRVDGKLHWQPSACPVLRRRFPVGESPTRQLLFQPEAIEAVMEVTKWLEPSM